jgi:NAD(P)-dependent dehydrogenase (short-subunit alcohol dehydrogenase family)
MDIPLAFDLTGKTVVITGGSGILGGEMACALGRCGAGVAVLGTHEESAAAGADAVRAAGGKAVGVVCDVTKRDSLEAARIRVTAAFGPCDILINGAGGNQSRATTSTAMFREEDLQHPATDQISFFDLTPDAINAVLGVNFTGTFLATQVFARDMVARRQGNIINISSMAASRPLTKVPAYSAAKAAVSNFTQWLAVHLAAMNIRVNAIAPGFFLTAQNRSLLTREDGQLSDRGKTIIRQTPLGRFGTASELTGTLLWLVNDQASGFVTGAIIPVDGGFSAFSGV